MTTLSNNSGHIGKSYKAERTHIGSQLLVLAGLGVMMLACFGLLLGCGSDNKPPAKSATKGKTATKITPMKSQAVLPMQNLGPVSQGKIKKEPLSPDTVLAPGLTVGEVEKRIAVTRKMVEDPNYELARGITKRELDNKLAAEQKRQASASQEIRPGVTKRDLDAKMAAHLKRVASGNEGMSGVNKQELNKRVAAEGAMRQMNREVKPGVSKDKLDAKLRDAAKQ